jgi:hypothetical protein
MKSKNSLFFTALKLIFSGIWCNHGKSERKYELTVLNLNSKNLSFNIYNSRSAKHPFCGAVIGGIDSFSETFS